MSDLLFVDNRKNLIKKNLMECTIKFYIPILYFSRVYEKFKLRKLTSNK